MSESQIKTQIRLAAKEHGVVLWDNPVGVCEQRGSTIHYGLCNGSSDLIGIHGQSGRFVAVEVKSKEGIRNHHAALRRAFLKCGKGAKFAQDEDHAYKQDLFVSLILARGGIAGFVTSVDEFIALVGS
jgi:hypothetical protein